MSGSAANAAARRRRLAPPTTVTPREVAPSTPSTPSTSSKGQIPLTPLNLLKIHDTKLNKLEEENKKLTIQLQNYNSSNIISRLDSLELKLNEIKPTLENANTNANTSELHNINDDKIKRLELELLDMKKLICKIQTFAMETNLSLMKYKSNNLDLIENEELMLEAATDEAATDEAATDEAATDEATTHEATTDEANGANITMQVKELPIKSQDLQEYFANQINK